MVTPDDCLRSLVLVTSSIDMPEFTEHLEPLSDLFVNEWSIEVDDLKRAMFWHSFFHCRLCIAVERLLFLLLRFQRIKYIVKTLGIVLERSDNILLGVATVVHKQLRAVGLGNRKQMVMELLRLSVTTQLTHSP